MIRGDTAMKYAVALKKYCDDMEVIDSDGNSRCSGECVFLKPANERGYRACKLADGILWASLDGKGGIE